MLEIVVTVCLLAHADTCHLERLPSAAPSLHSCLFQAQPRIAQWATRHPDWRVKSYHCGIAGFEKEA